MSLLTEIQCSIIRMHVANSLRSFLIPNCLAIGSIATVSMDVWACLWQDVDSILGVYAQE